MDTAGFSSQELELPLTTGQMEQACEEQVSHACFCSS